MAVRVRNDVPSRKGLMSWIHRFGGLYRSVELDATSSMCIDDAYVVGDLDKRAPPPPTPRRGAPHTAQVDGNASWRRAAPADRDPAPQDKALEGPQDTCMRQVRSLRKWHNKHGGRSKEIPT